jgi:hypothetical protein
MDHQGDQVSPLSAEVVHKSSLVSLTATENTSLLLEISVRRSSARHGCLVLYYCTVRFLKLCEGLSWIPLLTSPVPIPSFVSPWHDHITVNFGGVILDGAKIIRPVFLLFLPLLLLLLPIEYKGSATGGGSEAILFDQLVNLKNEY